MNQFFLESILLALLYRTLGMISNEIATKTTMFFIFGYVKNCYQRGGGGKGIRVGWVGSTTHPFPKYSLDI